MTRVSAIAVLASVTALACAGQDSEKAGNGLLLGVDGGGHGEIWLLDLETGTAEKLVEREDDSLGVGSSRWSPDGTRIAYVGTTYGEREFEVYVAAPDGSGARRLTANNVPEYVLAWSPDGRRIAVSRELEWNTHRWRSAVVLVDVETRHERVLFEGSADERSEFVADLDWSPDGDRIVVSALGRDSDRWVVSIVDVDSGRAEELPAGGGSVAWEPNGEQILFSGMRGCSAFDFPCDEAIEVVDAESGKARLLTRAGFAAAWSPDGREIAFVSGPSEEAEETFEILAVPVAGGKPRRLWRGELRIGDLDWR